MPCASRPGGVALDQAQSRRQLRWPADSSSLTGSEKELTTAVCVSGSLDGDGENEHAGFDLCGRHLRSGIAATAEEPAVRLARRAIACSLADRCFVVDSLDACHTEADKATAPPCLDAPEADLFIVNNSDGFVDTRDDLRRSAVRVIRCIDEVAPPERDRIRYMAGENANCEVALDPCLSGLDSDKGLLGGVSFYPRMWASASM